MSQCSRTFVLIPGASHGGWCYGRVAERLRGQGHRVFTPTLAGVGERFAENRSRRVGLTDHVREVIALFERESLDDVVLCGHSYGGMVIAGVADAIPDRIANLVFLDAVVPESGKCMSDYTFPGLKRLPILAAVWLLGRGRTLVAPPAKFFNVNLADRAMVDAKMTPHPFGSLQEKIRIGSSADRIPGHTYIFATDWGFAPIVAQYEQAKARPGWAVFEVACGHDIMIDAPDRLAEILAGLAPPPTQPASPRP